MIYILNLSGLRCPNVIITLRNKVRKTKKEEKILVLTNDKFSNKDIILFCRFMKHKLLSHSLKYIPYKYLIKIGKKKKY
ncbi:Sulfur carrier protein TusA [Buchnera aphidicola (Cinara piceae)]|uniref:Sulfur carrier protein TusA n=1 Tax=Buchnera aphidicola (Cinara piceae) TaxID=1660043 RepID=A0A803FU82_9GAMM|nr:sulfurtransferase TusA family protein [Buchnera aphidicola]VFP88568.1 Sulfur carrier protein TusA [Buchnera aphidicola (Cinara piceae)]